MTVNDDWIGRSQSSKDDWKREKGRRHWSNDRVGEEEETMNATKSKPSREKLWKHKLVYQHLI